MDEDIFKFMLTRWDRASRTVHVLCVTSFAFYQRHVYLEEYIEIQIPETWRSRDALFFVVKAVCITFKNGCNSCRIVYTVDKVLDGYDDEEFLLLKYVDSEAL